MSSILVTGAGGLVGGKVVEYLLKEGIEPVHAIYRHQPAVPVDTNGQLHQHVLDLTSSREVVQLIDSVRPRLVLHIAAMTNVDACEHTRSLAYAVNAACTSAIAQTCSAIGVRLLYVSTDYVFDGLDKHPGPYAEDAPVHPLNYYGLTKLQGEEAVQMYCMRTGWAICRTSVVYGLGQTARPNFVLWLLHELRAGHTVSLVTNQFSTPTLVDHLATMLIAVGQRRGNGIYHTAGATCLDRWSFALQLAEAFDLDTSLLKPVTTAELQQRATRPQRCGLLCDRVNVELGIQPLSVRDGIDMLHVQYTLLEERSDEHARD